MTTTIKQSSVPTNIFVGVSALFICCLVSAFSRVFTSDLLQQFDPIAFCFYTFTLGTLVFIALHFNHYTSLLKKIKSNLKNIFWLNVTTMGSWIFLTYPLKFIEPAIVSTITFGVGPILCLLLAGTFYKRNNNPFLDYLVALGLLITIGCVMKLTLSGKTAVVDNATLLCKITALLCCVIVGMSVVINSFQTKKLILNGLSPLDILVCRFYLLLLVSGLITFHHNHHAIIGFFNKDILFSSIIFVILPLYLIQIGQRELEPITVSVIMPFMPVLTFLFELSDKRLIVVSNTLYAILATLFFILLGTFLRYRNESMTEHRSNSDPIFVQNT